MSFYFQNLTRPEIKAKTNETTVAVVPLGAIEQHALHLPVNTDSFFVQEITSRAAELAEKTSVQVLLTPVLSFGSSHHHLAFGGTISLSQKTYISMVEDIAESLITGGVRKILFVNGHGGNVAPATVAINNVKLNRKDVMLFFCNYWDLSLPRFRELRTSPAGGVSHSCELETSLYMAISPESVRPTEHSCEIPSPTVSFECNDLLMRGPVWVPFSFELVSSTGMIGDASSATPEKGREVLDYTVEQLSRLICEISKCKEHQPKRIGGNLQ